MITLKSHSPRTTLQLVCPPPPRRRKVYQVQPVFPTHSLKHMRLPAQYRELSPSPAPPRSHQLHFSILISILKASLQQLHVWAVSLLEEGWAKQPSVSLLLSYESLIPLQKMPPCQEQPGAGSMDHRHQHGLRR